MTKKQKKSIIVTIDEVQHSMREADLKPTAILVGPAHFAKLEVIPDEIVMVSSPISGKTYYAPVKLQTEDKITVQGALAAQLNNRKVIIEIMSFCFE